MWNALILSASPTDTHIVQWRLESGWELGDSLPIATAIAVACAFALLLLPAHGRNRPELLAAAALALVLVALAYRQRDTPLHSVTVCVGYLLVVAVLRDAQAGSVSGFGALFLLPVAWAAWTRGSRELLIVLGAVLAALAAPLAIAGSTYPANSGRGSAMLIIAAAGVGLTIQVLRSKTSQATANARLLSEQNQGLRELDRMKDEFIAVISHELRTPLTSIAGYLELVFDDADLLAPDHHEFLTVVSRNVDRLTLLANDLLLLAAAENGTLTFAKTDFDLSVLLEEVANGARPHAAGEDVVLTLDVDGSWPVHADNPRLAQLFDNLISNAVKFTPGGGSITVRTLPAGDHVLVEVEDSGIGIPADELPRLFDPFYRARSAKTGNVGGTGLGLAIAKTIADAHEAQIHVASELGRGTTFQLRLPTIARTLPDPRLPAVAGELHAGLANR